MSRRTKAPAPEPKPAPAPLTEAEQAEIRAWRERAQTRAHPPYLEIESRQPFTLGGFSAIQMARFLSAFGTVETAFANMMLTGLLNAACDGSGNNPPSEQDLNRALAAVTGIGARDEIEGMLATQMVATHFAATTMLRRLKSADTIPQQDSAGNLAAKLLRAYAMQVQALRRYRDGGQQRMRIEHVHVHQGAQAIVGNVQAGGGALSKTKDRPHAPAITHEPGETLPREIEEVREAVPSAGG